MANSPLTSLGLQVSSTATGVTSSARGVVTTAGLYAVTGSTNQTGTIALQGSIDGTNWSNILSSTFEDSLTLTSSTFGITGALRANVTALGSTATSVTITIIGR